MLKRLALVLSLLFSGNAPADWKSTLEEGWSDTRKATSLYYDKASRAIKDGYEATLESVNSPPPAQTPVIDIPRERALVIWDDALGLFEDYSDLRMAQQQAPESAFFTKTKADYDEKIDAILQKIAGLMNDPEIVRDREKLVILKERIRAAELQVTALKAKAMLATGETKSGLLEQADQSTREIQEYQQSRGDLVNQVRTRLAGYGLSLSEGQVNVLLSRVDAEDILSMTTVFSVVSEMTSQFSETTAASGENLAIAKKYYGFHVALLELQLYIQERYIDRLQQVYITNTHRIKDQNAALIVKTNQLYKNATGAHRDLYQRNLKAQRYTLDVADLYARILTIDLKKIQQAHRKVRKNHELAVNTFETVSVSADLASQMSENRRLFAEIMALQAPELIPFENLQMQHEFEALSAQIADMQP
ncbi:MAG: hypothetical protein GY703_00080 [Gammaproteobacteria bacterium]|nr:hypothetical protein [Gammaproteobacteria bacterium]